ncbi:hypothetical protein GCM10009798_43410 [Nocardioides panacihumi]|uniref:DUF1918 domain-containing protein n=1 Tax=Nocardioides panacihumi TaxID=400774 RepID=A0ABP5DE98_9ACTN
MSARKPKAGDVVKVPDPAWVTKPSGQTILVVGGRYVLEADGDHKVEPAKLAGG